MDLGIGYGNKGGNVALQIQQRMEFKALPDLAYLVSANRPTFSDY